MCKGIDDLIEDGKREGKEEGKIEGEQRVTRLFEILMRDNRTEDMQRAVKDRAFQERLFQDLGL